MLVNIVNLFWSQFGRGNQTNYRYHTPKLGSCKTMNVYTEASTPNKWTIYWCDQGSRVKDWMVVAERFRPCKKNRINACSMACRRHKKNGAMTSEGANKRQKNTKTTENKWNKKTPSRNPLRLHQCWIPIHVTNAIFWNTLTYNNVN